VNEHRDDLVPVLEKARDLGFLGPGPVEAHLDHAAGFAEALARVAGAGWSPSHAADLGSGGGVPGLILARSFADTEWLLIEVGARRAAFLRAALSPLGLDPRVSVAQERAEVVGRWPAARAAFDLVVARSFGPPAAVAECAAPLLVAGGWAVVSEPPGGDPLRWPADGLELVGMAAAASVSAGPAAYQVLRQDRPCPSRWPRRVGVPAKRPLF
jgi:16S rRNA (guanine527-N7)-methyltransferase